MNVPYTLVDTPQQKIRIDLKTPLPYYQTESNSEALICLFELPSGGHASDFFFCPHNAHQCSDIEDKDSRTRIMAQKMAYAEQRERRVVARNDIRCA